MNSTPKAGPEMTTSRTESHALPEGASQAPHLIPDRVRLPLSRVRSLTGPLTGGAHQTTRYLEASRTEKRPADFHAPSGAPLGPRKRPLWPGPRAFALPLRDPPRPGRAPPHSGLPHRTPHLRPGPGSPLTRDRRALARASRTLLSTRDT